MGTITAASTEADIVACYLDNATYFEDNSVAKARAFVSACTALIAGGVRVAEKDGERLEFEPRILQELITNAQRFISVRTAPKASVRTLRDFRR